MLDNMTEEQLMDDISDAEMNGPIRIDGGKICEETHIRDTYLFVIA